jgi:hypothetical protein
MLGSLALLAVGISHQSPLISHHLPPPKSHKAFSINGLRKPGWEMGDEIGNFHLIGGAVLPYVGAGSGVAMGGLRHLFSSSISIKHLPSPTFSRERWWEMVGDGWEIPRGWWEMVSIRLVLPYPTGETPELATTPRHIQSPWW